MKHRLHIIIFFALILTGYGFQIARFSVAAKQYSSTHKYTKGLTKRVVAHINPGSIEEKKLSFLKKCITLKYIVPSYDLVSVTAFSASGAQAKEDYIPDYLSPQVFFSGKRGPPSIA